MAAVGRIFNQVNFLPKTNTSNACELLKCTLKAFNHFLNFLMILLLFTVITGYCEVRIRVKMGNVCRMTLWGSAPCNASDVYAPLATQPWAFDLCHVTLLVGFSLVRCDCLNSVPPLTSQGRGLGGRLADPSLRWML